MTFLEGKLRRKS